MGPIPGVEGLSTCTPCPTGPVFDRRVTEEVIPRLECRSMAEPSQCMKMAFVRDADKPTLLPVASGGTVPSAPLGFGASDDLGFVRYVYSNELSDDIRTQMPAVAEVQARLAAVIMGDSFARDAWADPPDANFLKNFAYFAAQNPNGMPTPAAGVLTPPTRRDLLCLRRLIEPHEAEAQIAFAMNTAALDALDRSTYQDGYPLDWRADAVGVVRPHLSGIPILVSDNISTSEPGGGTSVYALRFPGKSDAFGNDGVYLMTPPGEDGVQVFPVPTDASLDQSQFRVQMNRMLVVGSRTFVARGVHFGTD